VSPIPLVPIPSASPNHDSRNGQAVDILLLHYTGMASGAAALARLRDPAAKVSAHYLIEEDGRVFALVAEDRRAWHAGIAQWAGARDVNARSIGIELVNPGHEFGYRAFPEAQMASLVALGREILARHPIPAGRVLGHSDVAPARKEDPGELFDWRQLAGEGIGLWPEPDPAPRPERSLAEVQALLARYGYALEASGRDDEATRLVLTAFQRHFHPEAIGTGREGRADPESVARLAALVSAIPA